MSNQEICDEIIAWALAAGMYRTAFLVFEQMIETVTGCTASPHPEPAPDPAPVPVPIP